MVRLISLVVIFVLTSVALNRDYNAPLIPAPRPADSSAATIAATGLLLLAKLETTAAASKSYSDSAINVSTPSQVQNLPSLIHIFAM